MEEVVLLEKEKQDGDKTTQVLDYVEI